MISEQNMDPQLAMKILANFDRAVAETLNDKVKARLQFKVNLTANLPVVALLDMHYFRRI
jgi:predicted MPP superfamily phosphohydrolase